jgi:hypothetical protein
MGAHHYSLSILTGNLRSPHIRPDLSYTRGSGGLGTLKINASPFILPIAVPCRIRPFPSPEFFIFARLLNIPIFALPDSRGGGFIVPAGFVNRNCGQVAGEFGFLQIRRARLFVWHRESMPDCVASVQPGSQNMYTGVQR